MRKRSGTALNKLACEEPEVIPIKFPQIPRELKELVGTLENLLLGND